MCPAASDLDNNTPTGTTTPTDEPFLLFHLSLCSGMRYYFHLISQSYFTQLKPFKINNKDNSFNQTGSYIYKCMQLSVYMSATSHAALL